MNAEKMRPMAKDHAQVPNVTVITSQWFVNLAWNYILKRGKAEHKLQYDRLLNDSNVKDKSMDSVGIKYKKTKGEWKLEVGHIKENLVTSLIQIIPKKNKERKRKGRMTDEIIDMRKRREKQ